MGLQESYQTGKKVILIILHFWINTTPTQLAATMGSSVQQPLETRCASRSLQTAPARSGKEIIMGRETTQKKENNKN